MFIKRDNDLLKLIVKDCNFETYTPIFQFYVLYYFYKLFIRNAKS